MGNHEYVNRTTKLFGRLKLSPFDMKGSKPINLYLL